MKSVIICAALLVAIGGATAEQAVKADKQPTEPRRQFEPAPKPIGLPTYTREWPKQPVLEEYEAQWDYTAPAPDWWRHIPKPHWR